MTSTNEQIWLSTRQAAAVAQRHTKTISKALREGELHGSQRGANSSWRIHRDCLAAWLRSTPCPCAQAARGADVVPLRSA